ncbi:MAG: Ser-Thr-rich GPI-anchored membrane family protein [Patescibacteria group bacterium]
MSIFGGKKFIVVSLAVVVGAMTLSGAARAQTMDVQALQIQLNNLIEQVRVLQLNLKESNQAASSVATPLASGVSCYDFKENLKVGDQGRAVAELHNALERENFSVSADERNEKRFGEGTASAVTGFQQKYGDEVLKPIGLSYGTGFAGRGTRAKLNALYGCGTQGTTSNVSQEATPTGKTIQLQLVPRVVSPNGGEVFQKGYSYMVKWSTVVVTPVSFVLYKGGTLFGAGNVGLLENQTEYGVSPYKFTWTVPETLPDGSDYQICAYDARHAQGVVQDCSNKYFSIGSSSVPPSIVWVISPNGGETLRVGTTYQIRWNGSGYPASAKVVIGFDTTPRSVTEIANVTNSGSYNFTVPPTLNGVNLAGGSYTILVSILNSSTGNYDSDRSDAPFSIISATATTPSIVVVSPNGGEILAKGVTTQIRWAYLPLPPDQFAINLIDSSQAGVGAHLKTCGIQGVFQDATNPTNFSWSWRVGYDTDGKEIPSGNYRIFVYNCGNTNDSSDAPFSIVGAKSTNQPDLTVQEIYSGRNIANTYDLTGGVLSIKIGNIGSSAAPANTGHLYIWIDGQLRWTYSLGTLYDQSFLLPGGTMVGQPQILSGQHTIKAYIDPDNNIAESNENNNILEKTVDFSATPITVKTSSNLSGTVGASFNAVFDVFGGTPGYTFSVTAGSLPPGLSIFPVLPPTTCGGTTTSSGGQCVPYKPTSASLQGTPTQAGTYKFTLTAKDELGATGSGTFIVTIGGGTGSNLPPVISFLDAPTSLAVGQTGTWTIKASDPEGGSLRYGVLWGDEQSLGYAAVPSYTTLQYSQTATFSHSYAQAGTYTPTFTVADSAGLSAQTSASVNVGAISVPQAPVIKSISPGSGSGGTVVTLYGSGFVDPSTTCFTINGACYKSYSAPKNTTLDVGVPLSIPTGIAGVTVSNANGVSNSINFTITSSPKVWVTYPNDGGAFYKGNSYTITWSGNYMSLVNISLYKESTGVIVSSIALGASGAANGGSFGWLVPSNLSDGNDYKIVIADISSGVTDYSDFPFAIASTPGTIPPPTVIPVASITATSPSAGAVWEQGKTYRISWTSSNVAQVNLQLLKSNVAVMNIASYLAGSGSYEWAIPATLASGSDYKVRVIGADYGNYSTQGYDDSDVFSIGKGMSFNVEAYPSSVGTASVLSILQSQLDAIREQLQMLLRQVQ